MGVDQHSVTVDTLKQTLFIAETAGTSRDTRAKVESIIRQPPAVERGRAV